MLSSPEFYLWFLLPSIIGLFIILRTIFISLKRKSILSWVFTFIIFTLITLSEIILYQIFFQGSYPTFIPHLMIGFSLIIFTVQIIIKSKKPNPSDRVAGG